MGAETSVVAKKDTVWIAVEARHEKKDTVSCVERLDPEVGSKWVGAEGLDLRTGCRTNGGRTRLALFDAIGYPRFMRFRSRDVEPPGYEYARLPDRRYKPTPEEEQRQHEENAAQQARDLEALTIYERSPEHALSKDVRRRLRRWQTISCRVAMSRIFRINLGLPEPLATLYPIAPRDRLEPIGGEDLYPCDSRSDLRFYERAV